MATKYTLADWTRSTRFFPGTINILDETTVIPAGATRNLVNIAGKGQIICGGFYIVASPNQHVSTIYLAIDEEILAAIPMSTLNSASFYSPANFPFRLTKYDEVTGYFGCDFFSPLTFEESFLLAYKEIPLDGVNVHTTMQYALFE